MEGLECYPFMSDMREGLDGYKVWDRDWYQYQIQRRETEKVQFVRRMEGLGRRRRRLR